MENHSDISNEFVPYDLAIKLKELGFDKQSLGFYNIDGELMCRSTLKRTNSEVQGVVIAPLWQQAFDWFREQHDIHSYVDRTYTTGFYVYEYFISTDNQQFDFKSNEEARTACLERLIELSND